MKLDRYNNYFQKKIKNEILEIGIHLQIMNDIVNNQLLKQQMMFFVVVTFQLYMEIVMVSNYKQI